MGRSGTQGFDNNLAGANKDWADIYSTSNALHVNLENMGTVDDGNSHSEVLIADAVFIGAWVDLTNYASVIVSVATDEASATDGLIIEHSSDANNIDGDDKFTIPNNAGKVFTFMPNTQYFRVRYINGGTLQGYFRLQTNLKKTGILGSSHRIQDSISTDDDAELVKSVMTGQDVVTGIFENIQSFQQALHTHNLTHEDFVAEGKGQGDALVRKFGHRTIVGTTYSDIAQFTYDYTIAAAQPFEILSSSGLDVAGGDGARSITVEGVDGSGNFLSVDVVPNGSTPVALSSNFLWINRAFVTIVGVDGVNAGLITVRTTVGATPSLATYGIIEIGEGQTLQCVYYVPNGFTRMLLKKWGGGSDRGQDAALKLQTKKYALGIGGTEESWRTRDIIHLYQTIYFLEYQFSPLTIEPNTIIRIQAKSSTGSNNVVTASFFGLEQLN